MKRTEWYPADIDPHRVGWYEVKFANGASATMLHFGGTYWSFTKGGLYRSSFGTVPGDKWRGLTERAT